MVNSARIVIFKVKLFRQFHVIEYALLSLKTEEFRFNYDDCMIQAFTFEEGINACKTFYLRPYIG